MFVLRINHILSTTLLIITTPIRVIIRPIGLILAFLTFGIYLVPLKIIWIPLNILLVTMSKLWDRTDTLRNSVIMTLARILLALVGIPLAVAGALLISLTPPFRDIESDEISKHSTKANICVLWPFSNFYIRFLVHGERVSSKQDARRFDQLVLAMKICHFKAEA